MNGEPYYTNPQNLNRQAECRFRREPPSQPIVIVDIMDVEQLGVLVKRERAAKLDELKPFIQSTGAQLTPPPSGEFKQERHNEPSQ